jgi:hypothetical protein
MISFRSNSSCSRSPPDRFGPVDLATTKQCSVRQHPRLDDRRRDVFWLTSLIVIEPSLRIQDMVIRITTAWPSFRAATG